MRRYKRAKVKIYNYQTKEYRITMMNIYKNIYSGRNTGYINWEGEWQFVFTDDDGIYFMPVEVCND